MKETNSGMSSKNILLKIGGWLLIMLLSLAAILLSAGYLLESKAKDVIVSKINEQITVPVKVQGGIELSLLRHFPYAALSFHEVSVSDKIKGGNNQLMHVKEFSLLFNIWGLFSNHLVISKVYIRDGDLNLFLNEKGEANYDILKKKSTGTNAALDIAIQKAMVENVQFTYRSLNKKEDVRILLKKLDLKGNFSAARFDLESKSQLEIGLIEIGGETYLENKRINTDIVVDVDQQGSKFSLKRADLEIERNQFSVSGYFVSNKRNSYVNFTAQNKGEDVSKLIGLIPAKYKQVIEGTEGKGEYAVNASIKGNINAHSSPNVEVHADLENAEIQIPKVSKALKNVAAKAFYQIDSVGNDRLEIQHFASTFSGDPFSFELKLVHLAEPDFDFAANGIANLQELKSFFSDTIIQNAEGKIHFRNFKLKGNKRDFDHLENSSLSGSGEFELKEVEIQNNNITYGNINGTLQYNNKVIEATNFSFNFLSTDFVFNGSIQNLLPFIVSQNNRNNTADLPLGLNGKLAMKSFNLTNILAAYDKKNKPKTESSKPKLDIRDVFNMEGNLTVAIDKFSFNKLLFEDVKASISLEPYQINLNRLECNTMGGTLKDAGTIRFTTNKEMHLDGDLTIDKVDLPLLFLQAENFQQTTLTDKNLKGLVSASVQFKTVWKNYKEIDFDKLNAAISCEIAHGELLNFEPIKAASKFIKVEELNHIVFSDMTNQLVIKDRRITIPQMEVKSSALNLMLSGTHTLDNEIDYHLKINLHKLLANKFNRRGSDVQYIEEDPYEGVNLFLTLEGNLSNPKIKYDKASVKSKIKNDFKEEKQELKELFKKEKTKKKDEKETKREEKYFDTKEQPKFIDFEEEKKE